MESGPLRRILSSSTPFPSFKKGKSSIPLSSVLASMQKRSHPAFAVQCVTLISLEIKGQLWANVNDYENTCASHAILSLN